MPTIATDWFGERAGFPLEWSLTEVEGRLEFSFECGCPAACDELSGFVEGLWNRDVAEFFLIAADGSYQEFNLSPTGAWWCARFRGYRERDCVCPDLAVVTTAARSRSGWKATLSVTDALPWERFQVTAILGGRYFSTGDCSGEPDFHRF